MIELYGCGSPNVLKVLLMLEETELPYRLREINVHAAEQFSPPDLRNKELARAWRGMAFSLVEMNKLDEAEALYAKCLALDARDATALHELAYVRQVRAKAVAK